jgi:predicted MFS family arabinose efflux permease
VDDRGLWRDRDFRLVLGGQGVSAFGDAITFTALPLIVVSLTGSGLTMGIVGILSTLPDLLFGLPAGALADRWDRRRLIIAADLGRALLTALIPLAYLLGWPVLPVILLVVFPINCLRALFLAGWTSMMPALVGRDQVGKASSYTEAVFSLSFILGPALAGILVTTIGPGPTLLIDAATFAVSAFAMTQVHRTLRADRSGQQPRLLRDIGEGLRYLVHERTLRVAVGFAGLVSVTTAPLATAAIFYLSVDRGASSETVGLMLALFSVGYLVGALIASRATKGRLGALMLVANAVTAAAVAVFALVEVPVVQGVMVFLTGASQALWLVPYITLRSTITPDRLLGRVSSTTRMVTLGLSPVGMLLGGLALDSLGGSATLVAMAIIAAAASAVFSLSPALRAARAPRGPSLEVGPEPAGP